MKIVQMIDSLTLGGTQQMLIHLVRNLHPLGIEITIINLRPPVEESIREEFESLGVKVVTFPFVKLFSPRSFYQLLSFLRHERFDLIHAYLTYSNIIASLAGQLVGVPVIGSLRNAGHDPNDYSQKRDLLNTIALRYACTRVLANGFAVAEFGRKSLGDLQIDIIPNAVELVPPLLDHHRRSLRTELIGDADQLLILTVGRLESRKGFPELIKAFADLSMEYPTSVLVIAGGGYLKNELQLLINDLNVQHRVFLLGFRSDVSRLLAVADIYVNSSNAEGMAVSILEAMSAGLPVVATSVGDTPFVIQPGTGVLVPPNNPIELAQALRGLLNSPAERRIIGLAAREHIRNNYGFNMWRQKILELYSRITPVAKEYLLKKLDFEQETVKGKLE